MPSPQKGLGRGLGGVQQPGRKDAQPNDGKRTRARRNPHRPRLKVGGSSLRERFHVEVVYHPDVEENRDEAREDADDGKPGEALVDGRAEDEELGDEPYGRRDAGEGKHREGEGEGEERAPPSLAGEVRDQVRLVLALGERRHDGEGGDVHHRVRREVHEDADETVEAERDDPDPVSYTHLTLPTKR